jgi:hypothetical protein
MTDSALQQHREGIDLLTIGHKHYTDMGRDAVHIAVLSVVAAPGQTIKAGDGVYLKGGYAYKTENRLDETRAIGIADPFLHDTIYGKQRFWLFLKPGSITSLRHNWTHPQESEMTNPDPLPGVYGSPEHAEAWIRQWCDSADTAGFDFIMAALKAKNGDYLDAEKEVYISKDDTEYWTFIGTDSHAEVPEEFWYHAGILLGRTFEPKERTAYFSCSC